jgi:hypothetical protein
MDAVKWLVESARSWNHSLVVAKRIGDLPATEAAMRDRRDHFMRRARACTA